jgi:outer membrane protein OmpA-like peptidoglycan-associated protein
MHWIGLVAFESLRPVNLKPDFVLSGFPEYKTTVASLDSSQRIDLHRAAVAIVNSMSTSSPARGILVIGNADVALRKQQFERAGFELDVSQARADNALDVLLDEIARTSGNAAARYLFRTRAVGVGSTNRKIINASTEAQMRQNRRVEFILFHEYVGSSATCGVR